MDFSKLKNYLDSIPEEYNVPGCDCIAYKNHEMIMRYRVGYSDKENEKMMNGDELFLIFSMTKMITCTAALQIFERGGFLMSDPLSRYMPEFEKMKLSDEAVNVSNALGISTGSVDGESGEADFDGYAKNPVTIRDLFTMCAGFNYACGDEAIKSAIDKGKKTTREIVGAMSEKVLCFEPGTHFQYSLCHDVLGALVEVLSGKTLGVYMQENIFEPLGMKNTFFGIPQDEERLSRMAVRYTTDENGQLKKLPLENPFTITDEYESGGAGLISCVEDYAIFADAIACGGVGKNGNRILSSATVELMGTNHLKGQPYEDFQGLRKGYGYGLGVRTHVDKAVSGSLSPLGEFGWDGAAGAFSMVDTKNGISLVYFQHVHKWNLDMHMRLRNAFYSCLD